MPYINEMQYIYVLNLYNNKYYIGKSNDPQQRFFQHVNGYGSTWCRIYKPITIREIIVSDDEFDEDKYTLKYMKQFGIDNVRGGTFSKISLTGDERYVITKMIYSSDDKCFKCGKQGHFVKDCPNNNEPEAEVLFELANIIGTKIVKGAKKFLSFIKKNI